jgi:hypothetical protein
MEMPVIWVANDEERKMRMMRNDEEKRGMADDKSGLGRMFERSNRADKKTVGLRVYDDPKRTAKSLLTDWPKLSKEPVRMTEGCETDEDDVLLAVQMIVHEDDNKKMTREERLGKWR